jgi:uncharacterized lipoprotein YmbA
MHHLHRSVGSQPAGTTRLPAVHKRARPPYPMGFSTGFFAIALLLCLLTLTGCLSRPTLNERTYSFTSPVLTATNFVAGQPVLGIKKVEVASPFEDRSLVYRTGDFTYVRDPYATFLDLPGQELLAPLRAGLASQGDFSAVVRTASALKSDVLAEVTVSQLFGDFRQPNSPKAVLTIRFLFCDATNGIATKPILQKEYTRTLPISAPSATALMTGWNQALTEIIAEVLSDYRQAKAEDATH